MDGLKKIVTAVKSLKWYETIMCLVMIGIAIYYAVQPDDVTPQWLAIINLISGLCGVMCVFLTAKANRMNFPFAVVNTVVFMIYLFYFGIWATFWLEAIVYFPMNIISWYKWYQHKDDQDNLLAKSKKLSLVQSALVFLTVVVIDIITHFALMELAGSTWMGFATKFGWSTIIISAMQWIDSTIFAIGIVAVILEALRFTEQYWLWLITDVFAVAQYVLKKDPVYTTKKAIYLIEAVVGLKNWYSLSKRNTENE